MPPRDYRLRIEDILEAIEKIRRYTEGLTFEQFSHDDKTIDAVVRNITIIGEAARNVPDDAIAGNPDIPWAEMQDIRNVVVHEYFGISSPILWQTICDDLPPLADRLKKLQAEL